MKKLFFAAFLIILSATCFAQGQTYVNGYYRSNGTYVRGHYRTLPNHTRNDNWTTTGNKNPYTGTYGTRAGDLYTTNYRRSTNTNSKIYIVRKPQTYTVKRYNNYYKTRY